MSLSICYKKNLLTNFLRVAVLVLFASQVNADELVMPVDHWFVSQDVSPWLEMIEDPSKEMTFADVSRSDDWQAIGSKSFSQGYSSSAYWLRLKLENTGSQALDLLVAVEYPDLNFLDGYLTVGGFPAYKIQTGAAREFETRVLNHRNFIFPITIQGQQDVTFYLRVESDDIILWPMRLSTQQAFADHEQAQLLFLGIMVGAMLILALYHLFSYILMGEMRSLWLSVFVFILTLCVMTTKGLTSQFLWPNSPYWNSVSLEFLTWLSILLGVLYLLMFFHIRERTSLVKILALGYILILSVLYFASLLFDQLWVKYGEVVMQSISFLVFLGFAVRVALQGRKVHTYLAFSLFFLLGGGLLYMAYLQGYLAHNMLANNALPVGLLMSISFLTFALTEQIRQERLQQEMSYERMVNHESMLRRMQEDALAHQKKMTEELESRVAERTGELGKALKQLAESNRLLETVSSRDGLTGLRNAGYYADHFYKEWQRAQRDQTPLGLLLLDIDGLGKINDEFGHLTGDLCVRELARALDGEISRATDLVARNELAGFSVMLSNTPVKGAEVVAERLAMVAQNLFVVSDENKPVSFTVSVGYYSVVPSPATSPEMLQKSALQALRRAKLEGGAKVICGEPFDNGDAAG